MLYSKERQRVEINTQIPHGAGQMQGQQEQGSPTMSKSGGHPKQDHQFSEPQGYGR